MKGLKKMKNSIQNYDEYNENCTGKRVACLLLDYVIFYIIYSVMILVFYVSKFGVPDVSTDTLYNNVFENVIKTPVFSIMYLGIILVWEVVIPLLLDGQSISKKIFKIKSNSINGKKINLIIRGIVKIVILNPYGIAAYMIGSAINKSYINSISNILSVIFIISVIMFFKNKGCLHDRISKTYVSVV